MERTHEKNNYANFNRNNKWLGIIDYQSLIIFLIVMFLVWNILGAFLDNIMYRAYIVTIISIPFCGVFYANRSEENLSYIIFVVIKYIVLPKHYVYTIESNKSWIYYNYKIK